MSDTKEMFNFWACYEFEYIRVNCYLFGFVAVVIVSEVWLLYVYLIISKHILYIKYKIHSSRDMLYMKMIVLNLNKYLKKKKSCYIFTIKLMVFVYASSKVKKNM